MERGKKRGGPNSLGGERGGRKKDTNLADEGKGGEEG